jgi:hypothetical protein
LLCFALDLDLDLQTHNSQTTQIATWVQAERRPTERDQSEGTLTKEGPNQEQALLLTFGAFQK